MSFVKSIIVVSSFSLVITSCSLLGGGNHEKCSAYSQNFQDKHSDNLLDENLKITEGVQSEENI